MELNVEVFAALLDGLSSASRIGDFLLHHRRFSFLTNPFPAIGIVAEPKVIYRFLSTKASGLSFLGNLFVAVCNKDQMILFTKVYFVIDHW